VTDLAIDARALAKRFGAKWAVRNLDLAVRRGEVFGFLGSNGAGKSTSVKALLGLVRARGGSALVLGSPAGDTVTRRRIGFLPEHFAFHDWLSGDELLQLHGRLYGMPRSTLRGRIDFLLEAVGMTPHRRRKVRDYSKGMTQRIGLAQALLNEPDLVFLDEPTSGLDPAGRLLVRDLIRAERERGATVFLNSHLLGEVEATCDRVAFIRDGTVVDTHDLTGSTTIEQSYHIKANRLPPISLIEPHALSVEVVADGLEITLDSADRAPAIVKTLVDSGAQVHAVIPLQTTLKQLFIEIIGSHGGL